MTLYHEEKAYISKLRDKLNSKGGIDKTDLTILLDKFEEMTEMTSVTVKMIDRLMKNYDQLKQEKGELSSHSKH